MMVTYEIDTETALRNDAYRQTICRWLTANDIDPNDIPIDASIRVNELTKTIRLERYRRGEDGKIVLNARRDAGERQKFSVSLKADWSPEFALTGNEIA